jgi:hypothetical protein
MGRWVKHFEPKEEELLEKYSKVHNEKLKNAYQ